MTAAAEQTSITIPGVTVRPAALTVNKVMAGAPPAEIIDSLVLTQSIQVGDTTSNPNTQGFSNFTWTWKQPSAQATNDLATALAAAGWDTAMPCLDPTVTYVITVAAPPAS